MATPAQQPRKPVPEPDERSQPFFDAAARGELLLRRCDACSAWLHPAAPLCTECLAEDLRWEAASGEGVVYSFAVMHQFYHPGFAADLPYNLAVVELVEGPRLQTNLVDIATADIAVGMPVRVAFEPIEGLPLPTFRPA